MKQIEGVTIWKNHEAASIAAAHSFVDACHRSIAKKGNFVVALSGGTTPKRLYQILASKEFSSNISWKRVYILLSDERFVPLNNRESNFRMIKETLLDKTNIPRKNVFPIQIRESAKETALDYESRLRTMLLANNSIIDWLLLGIGIDGHTASLFPGTPILKEKKRLVKEVWLESKRSWRISFTYPLIQNAEEIIFFVTGKEKADIVTTILKNKKQKILLPAQVVSQFKNVRWILDEAAGTDF